MSRKELKTDSVAKISSIGALGESYLELSTGTNAAPPAVPKVDEKKDEPKKDNN